MMDNKFLVSGNAFIDGTWVAGDDTFSVVNPATGGSIQQVAQLNKEAIKDAISAADRAWTIFRNTSAEERSLLLKKWYLLIDEHKNELAELITLEAGKPLSDSVGEVEYGKSFVVWFAEESKRAYGETIPASKSNKIVLTIKESIGVVAAITPWNFPLAMVTRKIAPAIAAGCTVVLRPASQTPLTALALARLADEAGWPRGILNVVTGTNSAEAGLELTTNPRIRKLSFTGSTSVGKQLMQQSASTIKRMSLELGGNAPFIVFNDADIDKAVSGALYAKFRNGGQTCVAVNRFFVHDTVYNEFAAKLTAAIKGLTIGNGLDPDVQIGPLINQKSFEKVEEHIRDAVKKGARIMTGGRGIGGLFYEPTVLADVPLSAEIAVDETFGPVAALFKFYSEEEVISLANDTEYGLAAYFYSNDIHRCWRVARALEAGMIGVNDGQISFAAAPFGGIKESGIGREGSKYGLEEFMEIKYLSFDAS